MKDSIPSVENADARFGWSRKGVETAPRFVRDPDSNEYYAVDCPKGYDDDQVLEHFCDRVYADWDYPEEFELEVFDTKKQMWVRYRVDVEHEPYFMAYEKKDDAQEG